MAISKVVYGSDTLIDLTEDTVDAENLALGVSAHSANGETIVGLAPKTWTGTKADFESHKGEIPTGTIVNITDDYSGGGGGSTTKYGTTSKFETEKDSLPVGTEYLITDDYDEPTPSSSIDYSTEEQFSGKKWIDGNKIYQRSFTHEGQVTTSGITIGTVDNFYELTNVELVICNSSRTYWLTPTSSSRDNTMRVEVTTGGVVKILTDTSWSNPKVNLTIFYTKVGE